MFDRGEHRLSHPPALTREAHSDPTHLLTWGARSAPRSPAESCHRPGLPRLRRGRLAHGALTAPSSSTACTATSVGVRPTRTPASSSARALAAALPALPETIAPAWPIVFPAGAVKPAM